MFRSPFDDLGKKSKAESWEEVEGSFGCQQAKCYSPAVRVARYQSGKKVLIFECPNGHTNTIEGFEIE